jgi:hypothetical protein
MVCSIDCEDDDRNVQFDNLNGLRQRPDIGIVAIFRVRENIFKVSLPVGSSRDSRLLPVLCDHDFDFPITNRNENRAFKVQAHPWGHREINPIRVSSPGNRRLKCCCSFCSVAT